jgi:hypothetical protein
MDSIAICAVFQDAAARILEWVAFHRLIGVDRFVLYDLGSTDGTAALLARSRFGHQATVIDWARNDGPAAALSDFAASHANRFTWAAIIELDEFLHPIDTDTIRSLLPRYDNFSAVALRRVSFVTSRQQIRPGQLVIGSYTSREPDSPALNGAMPTLVRTGDLQGVGAMPPRFTLTGTVCDARGEPVPAQGMAAPADNDVMVVNRYPDQPVVEGRLVAEQRPAPMPLAAAIADRQARAVEAEAAVPDRRILRFIPRLRAMLHDASMAAQPRPAPPPTPAPVPTPAPAPTPGKPVALLQLGIGIVTYNRRTVLSETLDRVQQHTRHPRTVVAVADDGSTDGTLDMLRERKVLTVTGRNMSIAWNKNRALFLLSEMLRCDVVLLLEDDAFPARDRWEADWIDAAVRWGHANVAVRWIEDHVAPGSGAGTVDDPIHSGRLTAQCAVFSREALLFGGYFDTRFREYGHEHIEHTGRLLRLGYGGTFDAVNGRPGPLFKLLWGGIGHHFVPPVVQAKDAPAERSLALAHALAADFTYRAAWQNEDEARQMRDEMRHTFPRAVL